MPFMHKLSCRLALLKDLVWLIPIVAGACQLPDRRTGPSTARLSRLALSPPSALVRVNQNTDVAVFGLTASGDTAPIAITFRVRGSAGGSITGTTDAGHREIAHYQAAATAGLDSVIASDTSGLADTSVVIVTLMPVASLSVTPPSATVLPSQTAPFTATPRDSTGTPLTGRVITWTTNNTAVATVNSAGVATAVTLGSAAIIATSEGKSDSALVTVVNVPVASVTVAPAAATVAVGGTTPFIATTRDSAGAVLTGRVITWSSTNGAVATVNAAGVARGVAAGSASIIATGEGKADTSALTVIIVPVASVTVTPAAATIVVGGTASFTATTRDSTGAILTGRVVTWTSTNGAAASVSATGVATGVAAGSASIIVTSEGKSDTAALAIVAIPPPGAVPDPTLLPVANGQAPNNAAYTALNLPSRPAGYSYNDPVTGVRIWKVTSNTVPVNNGTGIGHDYADGGNQVSRGWGPNNNSHTILLLPNGMAGNYHIVDFTRGVGFANYRRLTVQPKGDLAATFSNLPGQPRILYILTSTQLIRYNTATMQAENTGFFPRAITADAWLHQDKDDILFAVTNYTTHTGYVWNSQTNQILSHSEAWMDEVRMERDGRYAVFTGVTTVRLWDLSNNTFGPTQTNPLFWFGHIASLRGRWVTEDPNINIPYATDRYDVNGTQITRTGVFSSGMGNLANYSGNWVQSDAELGGNLNKQWACGVGWGADAASFAWRQAIGFVRADGSDHRLLLHHYSSNNPSYYATPWGTPSPDGKVVIFNSNMRGSGRYDTFVAEVPLR